MTDGRLSFLVIDDNADGRFLLSKSLLRKFPRCLVLECIDAEMAVATLKSQPVSAVLAHRAADVDGLTLVKLLREASPQVPILFLSGIDRAESGKAAGATEFLNFDAWLMVGPVVARLLGRETEEGSRPPLAP